MKNRSKYSLADVSQRSADGTLIDPTSGPQPFLDVRPGREAKVFTGQAPNTKREGNVISTRCRR